VHKHHGSIKLISSPGATRFVVTLPVQFQKGESEPSGAAQSA
jgi:nitrogen-specific signal transduction histidine kinase